MEKDHWRWTGKLKWPFSWFARGWNAEAQCKCKNVNVTLVTVCIGKPHKTKQKPHKPLKLMCGSLHTWTHKPHAAHRRPAQFTPQYSTTINHLSTQCYKFTDPRRMDGLVDCACPRNRTRIRTARNQAACDRIRAVIQTDTMCNAFIRRGWGQWQNGY